MSNERLAGFLQRNAVPDGNKEKVKKILAALDGMSIFDAQELLGLCRGALLEACAVDYSEEPKIQKVFRSDEGAEVRISLKAECPTDDKIAETLSFVAQSSRQFYLEAGKEIKRRL